MNTEQFITKFLDILEKEYGKSHFSNITVSRAVEVIRKVIDNSPNSWYLSFQQGTVVIIVSFFMQLLLKDLNTKTLVSGDKVTRVTLETVSPEQVDILKHLADAVYLEVKIERTDG